MFESEIVQLLEAPDTITTVLDTYDAVMSLDEAKIRLLATDIIEALEPKQLEEIVHTAEGAYPNDGPASLRYIQQLLIFTYVNRAPGQPFSSQVEGKI